MTGHDGKEQLASQCLRGGQVLKEVGLDLQKQVRVGLYDNAERAFLDAQLDRKVLKGVSDRAEGSRKHF